MEQFTVAGPDPSDGSFVTPVVVSCLLCGTVSPEFGLVDPADPGGTARAPLSRLVAWAQGHQCGPALTPEVWLEAGEAVRKALEAQEGVIDVNMAVRAFATALQAVWGDVKKAASGSLHGRRGPVHHHRGHL